MSAINLALKTYSPVLNEVDQSTTWPYHMHLLGVRAGLAMNCPSSSLLSPCHSPYEFDRDPDHGQYSLYQEIKEECGQLVLNSDLTLKLPERMTRAALGAETYDRAIQKWLADLKINGGLWLCPHIPTSDESFRELVSLLLHSFLDDCNCKIRFRCRYCDTAIKLSGFQDEVYDPEVTEYGEGNEEEEDDDDDQGDSTGMIVGMDELVVSLDKGLGRLEHPRNAKDPKISFSDKLSHHLSMRIPSNIQVLTTLASGTLS
ncbi:hypothetical protein MMC10_000589 [Thelotrema lepadinum]|nr:hypothetical protein [Thelotrema lepadinum]